MLEAVKPNKILLKSSKKVIFICAKGTLIPSAALVYLLYRKNEDL